MPETIHEAGPHVGSVQRCARCGVLLAEGWVPGWEPGAAILIVDGDVTFSGLVDGVPTCVPPAGATEETT